MEATEALARLGGVATHRQILRLTSRRRLRSAVGDGAVRRLAHGRYALPTAAVAVTAAQLVGGVVALRSAAAHYEWGLKTQPPMPEVAIPAGSRLTRVRRDGVRLLWVRLADDEARDGVTTPLRTVVDCARRLPFDEALAIADSALRSGRVTRAELDRVIVRGAGAARVRRVLIHADGRAANPFESVLRALCIDAGLVVTPQQAVMAAGLVFHPDLVCVEKGVLIEADSFGFHSGRAAFSRDCERYNAYALAGWRLLRFTFEQVMGGQAQVLRVLRAVAAGPAARSSEELVATLADAV
ncbi:DUF559 domain-containing protein [Nocardioides cheoyonin]|uniref:DUF559 domain-containing protein n=1 Tax=Nocardioides cheoyonin TaxID=3156615 RepID=UPI0032B50C03